MKPGHISAGEIRSWGVEVPADIPDCASVPRSAILVGGVEVTAGGEPTMLNVGMTLTFTEPFRWITGTYSVRKP